jgi:hypothetical protein
MHDDVIIVFGRKYKYDVGHNSRLYRQLIPGEKSISGSVQKINVFSPKNYIL